VKLSVQFRRTNTIGLLAALLLAQAHASAAESATTSVHKSTTPSKKKSTTKKSTKTSSKTKAHSSTKKTKSGKAKKKAAPRVSAAARSTAIEQVSYSLTLEGEHFQNPAALVPFFERLYRLANESGPPVHVLQYGDSHTASDDWVNVMRETLQSRFGNGGPGFAMPGRPYRGFRRYDQRSSSSAGWVTEGTVGSQVDGMSGLGGVSLHTSRKGETVTLKAEADEIEVWLLRQSEGGTVSAALDNIDRGEYATAGEIGVVSVTLNAGPGTHTVEIRSTTNDPVRILGTVAQNHSGVTWETMGINGAQIGMLNAWSEPLLEAGILARDPALIVFAYGTNEANARDWNAEEYEAGLRKVLATFRRLSPTAVFLLVGPPDCRVRSSVALGEVIEIQRRVAESMGAAFWDWRGRMGGAGSVRTWVTAGYGQGDYVHLTAPGYQLLGKTLAGDLMRLYDRFVQTRKQPVYEQTQ
jgi:lysophospholipase L1-like esterase